MHGYYVFEVAVKKAEQVERCLVMFSSVAKPDSEELGEAIEEYCDDKPPPDTIVVLGPATIEAELLQATSGGKFAERIRSVTRYHNAPHVEVRCFDWKGDIAGLTYAADIRRVGMTDIFRNRGAMLETPPTHHYGKPSRKHSRQFLRIGNAMVSGAEIDFIAFCCLPAIPKNVRHFYCDTGAIAPIAYALNTLRSEADPQIGRATVDSFGSYDGAKDFQFRNMAEAIVLISATTSEGLAKYLADECTVSRSRIVTVFHLGEEKFEGTLVCDLKQDDTHNPDGFDQFPSYPPDDCPLCNDDDSTLIRIEGDQFLTGETTIEEVSLVAADAAHLQTFFKRTAGNGLVRAYYSVEGSPATSEVFFDLEAMFADEKLLDIDDFQKQYEWIIDQQTPASLKRIITLDDPASQKFAVLIKQRIRKLVGNVQIVKVSDIRANLEGHIETEGATMVVASAVASGRTLLSVSQILRKIQPNELITYIVGLARLPRDKELNRIRTNVTYGQNNRKYGFHLIDSVNLPLYGPRNQTSWDSEKELWTEVLRKCDDKDARDHIKSRLEQLRQAGASNNRGMDKGLFWPTFSGNPLALRPGFAFYTFETPSSVSQADVFFAVLAVLHSLRLKAKTSQSLRQHEHVRHVISPRNFERFNDGIIQAAFLRAAHAAELDYSASRSLSDDMAQILDSIFEQRMRETGEAAPEFILALAMRTLRLDHAAVKLLADKHASAMNDPISKQLWQMVRARNHV
jgi:hypothetical protein